MLVPVVVVDGVAAKGDSDIGRADEKRSEVVEPVAVGGIDDGEKVPEPGAWPPFAE